MRDAVAATGREVYELGVKEAIERGNLSGLQLLRQRGDLDEDTDVFDSLCIMAARDGHLATLKWLRSRDFPWDEDTCKFAAEGKHFELLSWARANGAPEP